MTHDELLALLNAKSDSDEVHALRAVLQIKDRPRYSDAEADMWRSEAWNQALFVVREVIAKELV